MACETTGVEKHVSPVCIYIYIYEHSFFDWGGEEGRQTCLEIYGFGARDSFSHMIDGDNQQFPFKVLPLFLI